MPATDFLDKGVATVKDAIAADNAKDYRTAYDKYKMALEYLVAFLKHAPKGLEATKKQIAPKVEQYMARAEQLKKALDAEAAGGAGGGGGTPRGGGDGEGGAATAARDGKEEEKEDKEKKKLRDALSSVIMSEKPNVKWDDVAGLEGAKDALKEAVILPARFPQLFNEKRRPWKGVLLYGPPGTGKSYLAKAVATEAQSTFLSVSSSDLVSKWQGESERLVKNLFEMARGETHSIIFIDEIDSLVTSRSEGESDSARRIKTEFLVQMDGVGKGKDNILVLGATNTPWEIDMAMRRRFEKKVYIPLPSAHARAAMFKIHLGKGGHTLVKADFDELGADGGRTEGMSGSDIKNVVRDALMEPLRKCRTAKWFRRSPSTESASGFTYMPILTEIVEGVPLPPCSSCPRPESGATEAPSGAECRACGAVRKTLYELASDELRVPEVSKEDFWHVLEHCKPSVAPEELLRFEEWTKEFGEDGV